MSINEYNAETKDYFVKDQIEDSISSLKFFPNSQSNILASGGWDCKVRIWNVEFQVNPMRFSKDNITSSLFFEDRLSSMVLSICWGGRSPRLLAGCVDGTIYYLDIQKNQQIPLGKHALGCKALVYNEELGVLFSGGWDGKINIWDLRSSNPIISSSVLGKVQSMSNSKDLLVVSFNDKGICYYDLNKLKIRGVLIPEATYKTGLSSQTTKVSCFPDGEGYIVGSIIGRCSVKHVDLASVPKINPKTECLESSKDFSFKCQRKQKTFAEIYSVNDIAFNIPYKTFATVGGDGTYNFFDKYSQSALGKGVLKSGTPITACDYSYNGHLFAYAFGYDWSLGIQYDGKYNSGIGIRYLEDKEKKRKTDFFF